MLNKSLLATLIVTTSIVSSPLLLAHGEATGIVKERMDLMDDMKAEMKKLSSIFKGQQDYNADLIRQAASVINRHSGEAITRLFPEDSLQHSEAKPILWQEWSRFQALAKRQGRLSQALYNAADNDTSTMDAPTSGGMMGNQGMMGQSNNMMSGRGMMSGQGMMSDENMMGGMMAGSSADHMLNSPMDTVEHYSQMPSEMVFRMLADNCSSCHKSYRKKD